MKITRLTTYHLPPRWMLLGVGADEGIAGWNEPVIEDRAHTVGAAVRELSYYLIGQDPSRINDLQQTMYHTGFYCGGPILISAAANIDRTLWDIKGKVLGMSVYELLGGLVHDKIRTRSWVGGDCPADVIAGVKALQAVGFDHLELNGCKKMDIIDTSRAVDVAVTKVAEIRSAFDNTVEFGLGFHGRVSASMAEMLIKELKPYRPPFIEEPVLAEQAETYVRLATHTHLPITAGERMLSRFDLKRMLEAGGVSTLQPDLSHADGIAEYVRITAMVETYDVALTPHYPFGPIALAVCLHMDFVSWNATLQERSMDIHYNRGAGLLDYVRNEADFALEDEYIRPPHLLGLGMDTDEALVIERNKEAPDWRNPVWRHADSSVTER